MKNVIVLLILFIAAIVAADKFLLPYLTESGEQLSVPDVRNMSYDMAVTELRKKGLKATKRFNVRYLPDVSPDLVIDQVPEPNSVVKPGRSISLVLNRRDKPSYPVPDLVGRTETEARRELERLGMVVTEVQLQAVSDSDEDGRVLSQSVPPDVVLKSGSEMSFIVGKLEQEPMGARLVVVPDVLGMSVDQARSLIIRNGMRVGKVSYEHSYLLVPGTVVSQKPSANAMVQFSQTVDITVAAGDGSD
ncbi:PASTA domain-containing protein [Chlorobaculum sp. 24CR]|uniref:PASTA domain-containing protein n=1 Tax=Chlorobaculum sp. 24CR TaxID=2508878 RepID=UPI00100AA56F|nr:PASTA domain-containing protein [Chlorobaculum sp. 24CR]RXK87964.1 PASTA domain-containing protein [Chlorobaculum sp. 24CR]